MRVVRKSEDEAALLSVVRKSLGSVPSALPLLVCVSGGADSVALLHAVHALGRSIVVANCNFHLRGEESDRDSAFVQSLCMKLGVEVKILDFDTKAYCEQHGVSVEMACRELRYAEFRNLKTQYGCSRIVVAHNADDNIETLFLNLMRGTGLKGLCGMSSDNGEILRPLLSLSRREIEAYLDAIGADYVNDSSNVEDDFRRNFIRLRVLPLLESRWPGMRKAVASTMDNLRSANEVCETSVEAVMPGNKSDFVSREMLAVFPSRRYLLHAIFSPKGATSVQLREMESAERSGAQWQLPDGVIRLQNDGFHYYARRDTAISCEDFHIEEVPLTPSRYDEATHSFTDNSVVWLPGSFSRYEWITLKQGMRFAPLGMSGTKKIADMMRDARIAPPSRLSWPLLRDRESGHVIWIPGVRRSRYAPVVAEDKMVTKISMPHIEKVKSK